jgi:ABC-2 type transport system permease protein/lipopolysaccharide transport system permease protein
MGTRTSNSPPHLDFFPAEEPGLDAWSILRTLYDDLYDLARYAFVVRNFVLQDLRVRYNRSALGFLWSLLNPALMMATLTIVFSQLMGTNWRQYAFHLLSGMVAWGFLATSLTENATVFVTYEALIRKIYLPKLIYPLSRVLVNLSTFVLSLCALYLLLMPLGARISWAILTLPAAIALFFTFVLGLSIALATLNTFYRDCGHLVTVVLQAWYFLTPIFYEPSQFPKLAALQWINPAYPFIRIFQRIIRDGVLPPGGLWLAAASIAFLSIGVGYATYKSCEDKLVFRL